MNEWKTLTVPEFSDVISGATPATNVREYWDGDIEWVTPVDLSKLPSRFINDTIRKISKKGLENSSVVLIPKYNIVMSSRAPIGYFAIPTKDFTTNQGCKSFKLRAGHDAEFHYYSFLFNIDYFKRYGSGSTFAEISKSDIEKLNFTIPTDFDEQRKIARILSIVDQVIERTEGTIAKYKAIKQGMMQDLFTRGIEVKTGKLRPRYQDAPDLYKQTKLGWVPKEWNQLEINDICSNFINGGTPSTKIISYWQGHIPWVTGADFLDSFEIGIIRRHITNLAVQSSATHVIPKGTLLLVTRTGVGKLAIAPFDIAISQDITGLILGKDVADVGFYYFYFQQLAEEFKKLNQGTSINGIIRSDLVSWPIIQPPVPEQNWIYSRLLCIDNTLNNEIRTLSKYKELKLGLMTDLLTARKSVKVSASEVLENTNATTN